ncbi:MAG: glycerol kinase GlpK [Pseudomonadota bacterium]
MSELIVAIDQGTTSSRATVYGLDGQVIALAQQEFPQHYPASGWVEHDPQELWDSVVTTLREAVRRALEKHPQAQVVAAGITNQRETVVLWDRRSGEPLHRAIVWQDRRTAQRCEALQAQGLTPLVTQRTGLQLDPYFSATKIAWILDQVPGARERAARGELAAGTIDCYLIWRLTGGRSHCTDVTNASRTSLYDIDEARWDDELAQAFGVPVSVLPEVRESVAEFGRIDPQVLAGDIPILGVAGDQQAASIGQGCVAPGPVKSTYGTGCFMLANTGETRLRADNGLLATIAYAVQGRTTYALEGSIFSAGSVVQWLRDALGIISDASQTEALAASLDTNDGVILVPAFSGLGAPYWDPHARAAVLGLSRGAGRAHFARAALESIAYQTDDLLQAFRGAGVEPSALNVDGGLTANGWCMQFTADVTDVQVRRPINTETTSLGAACLAMLGHGALEDITQVSRLWQLDCVFDPSFDASRRGQLLDAWRGAVARTRSSTDTSG